MWMFPCTWQSSADVDVVATQEIETETVHDEIVQVTEVDVVRSQVQEVSITSTKVNASETLVSTA